MNLHRSVGGSPAGLQPPRYFVAIIFVFAFASTMYGAAENLAVQHGLAIPMEPVTLRDLPPSAFRASEHHEQRREGFEERRYAAALTAGVAIPTATVPTLVAPPVSAGFRSTFDTRFAYPSDANGAVGLKHVLSVSNTGYMVNDRAGKILWQDVSYGFWHDPNVADGGLEYDARAAYDPLADRWVIASLFDRGSLGEATLLIAISATGDPAGTWKRFRIPIVGDSKTFFDFTRMALTRDAIVITANITGAAVFAVADLFVVQKTDAYAGPATLPYTRARVTGVVDLIPISVHGFDDPSIRFIADVSTQLAVYTVQNGSPAFVSTLPIPPTAQNFSGNTVVGPQKGGLTRMDTGYPVVHYAVQRNGVIWIVESVFESSPLRSSIAWWRVHLPISSSVIVDKGLIDDPAAKMFFGFPSIDVNAAGGALIGYSTFTALQFPSAGYSYIDPAGNLSQSGTLKAGEVAYNIDRWADYSMTVVDPVDDTTFWTVQTYAMTPPDNDPLAPRWSMWWGEITPGSTVVRRRPARH